MKRGLLIALFITVNCVLESQQLSPPRPTCAPCKPSSDRFCETELDPETCECATRCCAMVECEPGTYRDMTKCTSCSSPGCACIPEPTPATTCAPCPKPSSRFCDTVQIPGTCECATRCCAMVECEPGTYRDMSKCTSCSSPGCACIPTPTPASTPAPTTCAPCKKPSSPFCSTKLNPETCECATRCCALAQCPAGTERRDCTSCSCPCQPIITTTPKPTCKPCAKPSSAFCSAIQDASTCKCDVVCCKLARCPAGTERKNCTSCNCPCKPIPTPPPTTCAPCVKSKDRFCDTVQIPGSCKCATRCCAMAACGPGTYRDMTKCTSCSSPGCKCIPKPTPVTTPAPTTCAPCPKPKSVFCTSVRLPNSCNCTQRCCSLARCPAGTERRDCKSCSCPCQPIITTTPKPTCKPCAKPSSVFCSAIQDASTCKCNVACCSLARCPAGAERKNCTSCNCPCQPIPTPATTCAPCAKPSSGFCETSRVPGSCECVTACCDLAQCGPDTYRDMSKCKSCRDPGCACIPKPTPKPTCKPCDKPSSVFCTAVQEASTCKCRVACCSLAPCPSGTERKNCTSCNCPCQPIPTPPTTCAPCVKSNRSDCVVVQDPGSCKCITRCLPPPPTRTSPPPPRCAITCPPRSNSCMYSLNTKTCRCDATCCSLSTCPPNTKRACNSCFENCPCLPLTTTQAPTTQAPCTSTAAQSQENSGSKHSGEHHSDENHSHHSGSHENSRSKENHENGSHDNENHENGSHENGSHGNGSNE